MADKLQMLEYLKNPVDYVSGGDGQLFINEILVDECYDIQYSYREMKEPVYGYRSTHFDAVIPGTVLITGQFTINYIHDGYLYSILNVEKVDKLSINSVLFSGNSATEVTGNNANLFNPLLKDGFDYKTTLQQYNELRKFIDSKEQDNKDITSKMAILEASISGADARIKERQDIATNTNKRLVQQASSMQDDMWYNKEDRMNAAKDNWFKYEEMNAQYEKNKSLMSNGNYVNILFLNSKIENIQSMANALYSLLGVEEKVTASIISQLQSLNEQYGAEARSLVEPGFFNGDNNDYAKLQQARTNVGLEERNEIAAIEAEKESLRKRRDDLQQQSAAIETAKGQLDKLKSDLEKPQTNAFIRNVGNYRALDALGQQQVLYGMSGDKDNFSFSGFKRPESEPKPFEFQIKFNGLLHKKLIDVHLVGHSHMFGVGGEPVKETYTFLAKKLG
jgi:hypothetical protein